MFFNSDNKPLPILGKKEANKKPGTKPLDKALKCLDQEIGRASCRERG